jgi:mono/diheme cytochrome c family protein
VQNKALATPLVAAFVLVTTTGADNGRPLQFTTFPNATGASATLSTTGPIDRSGPFFQALGINGRSCGSCHQPADGWSITPESVRQRFEATAGTDPIFRVNDGSNSPNADVSTVEKRRAAFSMLLTKGLIRVGIGIPPGAEFELAQVDDPYGFASASELSLFRRPLPSTNLKFLNTVMWDGRETFTDDASTDCIRGTTRCFASLHFNLSDQANGATQGHAQAPDPLTPAQRDAIVAFEMGLFTAQVQDVDAKSLGAQSALGGPNAIADQDTYFGINDGLVGE